MLNKIKSSGQDKIVPAMIEARKKITGAVKGKTNDFFRSTYVDLPSVIQCCNKELLENDLLVSQPTIIHDGKVYLVTEIMHVSGQWKRGYLPIINKKQDDQGQGSALTYTRRQGLLAILNIPALDDDAEATTVRGKDNKKGADQFAKNKGDTALASLAEAQKKDIGWGDEKITKKQEGLIEKHATTNGLSAEALTQFLKSHKIKNITDIRADRFGYLKSEISRIGLEMRKEETTKQGDLI
jgi:hypothetical protein